MDKDKQQVSALPPAGDSQAPAAASAAVLKQDPANDTAPASAKPAAVPVLKRMKMTGREKMKKAWQFAKEAWDEHELWVEALAVKGGASAIIIAGIVGLSTVVALPFVAAAGVIAGCCALIGIGIYSCAAAGAKLWESCSNVYARVMGREPKHRPQKEKRDIIARLKERTWVKKMLEHRFAQKIFNSRAWKMTEKFTRKRENAILQGMAVGGALVTLALGASVLATQILVLPVIAVGTLATFATVEVLTCFASGTYGLYLSGQSIMEKRREKKAEKLAQRGKPEDGDDEAPTAVSPQPEAKASPAEKPAEAQKPLTPVFTDKAAYNDNPPAAEKPGVAVPAAKNPAPPAAP